MIHWDYIKLTGETPVRAYLPNPRFELRQVMEMSGQEARHVWALFEGGKRKYEVHALGNARIVMADSLEFIEACVALAV